MMYVSAWCQQRTIAGVQVTGRLEQSMVVWSSATWRDGWHRKGVAETTQDGAAAAVGWIERGGWQLANNTGMEWLDGMSTK